MLASWKPPLFHRSFHLGSFFEILNTFDRRNMWRSLSPASIRRRESAKPNLTQLGARSWMVARWLKKWTCHTSWTPPRWKYEGLQQRKPCRCLLELAWRTAAGRQTCCTTSTSSMMSPRYSFYIQKIRWKAVDTSQMPPPHHSPHSYFKTTLHFIGVYF